MSDAEPRLRRDIGLTSSAFLSFNGIVGAGIFALPATLHLQFGTFSPWLFPLFGLLVLVVAWPFARLAAEHSESGGPVAYTVVFGRFVAFEIGWLYYLARIAALAANANVFAIYAAAFWGPLGTWVGRAATMLALIGLIILVNVIGVRRAVLALDGLTLLKALPLIALALWGIAAAESLPAPGAPPPLSEIEAAALLILYAFVGFENSVVPAGETDNPRRTISRALIVTIMGTATLYFLVQLAYVAVMPVGQAPEAPLAAFAQILIGPAGALLLAATALASIAGNISGSMTSTPRATYALSRQGSLPRWFGEVSPRFHTPANSILFMGVTGAGLAISGSFVWLAIVSTLARLFVYAASIAALPRTARQGAGYLLIPVALLLCAWAAWQSAWLAWIRLAALAGLGVLLYLVARRQAGSSSADTVDAIQPPPSNRSPS